MYEDLTIAQQETLILIQNYSLRVDGSSACEFRPFKRFLILVVVSNNIEITSQKNRCQSLEEEPARDHPVLSCLAAVNQFPPHLEL